MGHKGVKRRWLGVVLLGLLGCTTAQPDLKPPPRPEELHVPPVDDVRYSNPTPYPKDTLNTDLLKRPGGPGGLVDPTGGRMQGMGGGFGH